MLQKTASMTVLWFVLIGLLSGCQQTPLKDLESALGARAELRQGEPFLHHTVSKHGRAENVLHVYIEGDGQPWYRPDTPAWQPEVKAPLMAQLMQMDAANALYLGRPCYHGTRDPACNPLWWTHQRYAQTVVTSMNHVLSAYVGAGQKVVLIGHSGGGALALLMAAQRADVVAVITIAANVDPKAWAEWHQYSALEGSLNPRDWPLPEHVLQRHYYGQQDQQVPYAVMAPALSDIAPQGKVEVVEHYDHHCCWAERWPQMLTELRQTRQAHP